MTVDEVPVGARIGRLFWNRVRKKWMVQVNVNGRKCFVRMGDPEAVAQARWASLLVRLGHGAKPDGKMWYWCAQKQCWYQGYGALTRRRRLSRITRAWRRIQSGKQRIREHNDRAHANAEALRLRLVAKSQKEIDEYLKTMKYDQFVKESRELEPTLKEMRMVVTRQMVGPMRLHAETASWFCWIGVTQRKLLMLGQQKEVAEKAWLLLKHSLEGGSRILLTALKARRPVDRGRNRGPGESVQTESDDHP